MALVDAGATQSVANWFPTVGLSWLDTWATNEPGTYPSGIVDNGWTTHCGTLFRDRDIE
jgi:hypothetical protein